MNTTLNTTAGLFIEESDDEHQDDIKDESQHQTSINHNLQSQSSLGSFGISQSLSNQQHHHHDDDDDDEEEVELSLREQVIYLTTAWRNEKLSPEILQYEDEMVESVKEAIDEREAMIEDAEEEIASAAAGGGNKVCPQNVIRMSSEIICFLDSLKSRYSMCHILDFQNCRYSHWLLVSIYLDIECIAILVPEGSRADPIHFAFVFEGETVENPKVHSLFSERRGIVEQTECRRTAICYKLLVFGGEAF